MSNTAQKITKKTGKFAIGERGNPQLKKPYFVAYGRLTAKEKKDAENCAYGSMYITTYDSKEEYFEEIERLTAEEYKVNKRDGHYESTGEAK